MKTIRLKPKIDARKFRYGYPWIYSNQIVSDRRTKSIQSGEIVALYDHENNYVCHGAFNFNSKIVFRTLELTENVPIDSQWIENKLSSAMALRTQIYYKPFYRLVHAEGDGLPGLIIDRFGDYAIMQPNAYWAEEKKEEIVHALTTLGMPNVILNASGRARKLEGLDNNSYVLRGEAPQVVEVELNDAIYHADIAKGQKTGLFYDQRENHAFAAKFAEGARCLDVFSHVGGFGLAMLAKGASDVTCVDSSAPALEFAALSSQKMNKSSQFNTVKGDAFDVMANMADQNLKFDVVVCDPPAFAPSRSALSKGLRAYERVAKLAAQLVEPNGILALCSCSHAATPEKFISSSIRGIGRARKTCQVLHQGAAGPDHPIHPQLIESSYLKSVFMRVY